MASPESADKEGGSNGARESPSDRFKSLARGLLSVPPSEILEEERLYREAKDAERQRARAEDRNRWGLPPEPAQDRER
jgi:hypothetical protein